MKSMTAYAQVPVTLKNRRFRLELQSLNKKGLDLITDLPQSFTSLNIPIRLYLSSRLERGSVLLRLKEENQDKALFNEDDLRALKDKLTSLANHLNFDPSQISFQMLLDKASSAPSQDIQMEELEPFLKSCCDLLIKMREFEGKKLREDFANRFHSIVKTLKEIESMQQHAPEKIKHKLLERLKALDYLAQDDERLAKEVIYFVDKQDVTEELTRLKSHLEQMSQLLDQHVPVGRKLEFLVQECFRELNTLSAKTSELSVINLTLNLKTEFEKIKEQVMNIE